MAYDREQIGFPAKAGADLSGLQFFLVKMSGDNEVNITDTALESCNGVLQNKPESGQHADICCLGISKVRVGLACSYGNNISVADSGWADVATSGHNTIGFIIDGCNSGGTATALINCANADLLA